MNYREETNIKAYDRVNELLEAMPSFAWKFFSHLKTQGSSSLTCIQYAYDMKRFFDYLNSAGTFKNLKMNTCTASDILDALTIEDIQEYIKDNEYYYTNTADGKQIKHMSSPSVIARRVSCLRSFYKYYYRIGDITNNLSDLIDVPKIPDKVIRVMDRDQVARILAAVKDTDGLSEAELKRHNKIITRDYAIMMLFFGTGLRVSELVGIDTIDVDFYEDSILVTRKGGDQDEVYFGPEVENALLMYLENGRDGLLGGNIKERAFFLSMQHKRISVRNVETMIKGYASKAGINTKVTPHSLRRTFGTNLYEETGDIYLVADALHHSSVETTKKHYAKMSKDHKRIAAKKSSTLFEDTK